VSEEVSGAGVPPVPIGHRDLGQDGDDLPAVQEVAVRLDERGDALRDLDRFAFEEGDRVLVDLRSPDPGLVAGRIRDVPKLVPEGLGRQVLAHEVEADQVVHHEVGDGVACPADQRVRGCALLDQPCDPPDGLAVQPVAVGLRVELQGARHPSLR
jgi:hypothetical protein